MPLTLPSVRGKTWSRSARRAFVDTSLDPLPASGTRMTRPRPDATVVAVMGARMGPPADAPCSSALTALRTARAAQIMAGHHDLGRRRPAGERHGDLVQGLRYDDVTGQVDDGIAEPHAKRRRSQRQHRYRRGTGPREGTAYHSPDQRRPQP